MAFPRWRNLYYYRLRFLVKAVSPISAPDLCISFLVPSPIEFDYFQIRRHQIHFTAVVKDPITNGETEAVTHPTWYLAIATSGGLNQQRTGVIFVPANIPLEEHQIFRSIQLIMKAYDGRLSNMELIPVQMMWQSRVPKHELL